MEKRRTRFNRHSQFPRRATPSPGHHVSRRKSLFVAAVGFVAIAAIGCGYAGNPPSQSAPPPTAPPPVVTVSVQPGSANLSLGATQQFQATVTGTSNTAVAWEVNGGISGSATLGTISATGLYTAPGSLPSPPGVTITAISAADATASGSANVTLTDSITVNISPLTATVLTGGAQVFTASVSGSGSSATGVAWSVNGIAGGNATVGTIVAGAADAALYTAPLVPPSPPTVSIAATSLADPSKFASASVTVACSATNSVLPAVASIALGSSESFSASFCLPSGTTITWDVNGFVAGNAIVGTIAPSSASNAIYTAPADLPPANPVTIHATAGTATAFSIVTVTSHVTVSISPPLAMLGLSQRSSFAAAVAGTADGAVTWSVDGIPNGNSSVGVVCVTASNPCVPPLSSTAASVDYIAPASLPAANPVTLLATSHADPSQSGASVITIAGPTRPVSLAISPPYAFLPPSTGTLSSQQFFAAVPGSSNKSVTWTPQSAVPGTGCAGAACGSVSATGLYSAPTVAPSPNAVSVIATSQADATKSASANVALTSGPLIEKILPSSVIAGAVESIPFELQGANFIAGSGATASVILLNGAPRITTCPTATVCTMALSPIGVQSAATIKVQVQNPPPASALSNPVPFVIVPFDVSVGTITLSSAQPAATGINIIVTEPTTAAASSPISVEAVGYFTGGGNCGVQGSPLTVTRPSSGSAIASICILGDGLDPSFAYAFTAPGAPPGTSDIGVTASAITGLLPGLIELDLQITSATVPGVRTLFITTLENDRAVATGFLEVK
jgi:hypothetical protein